MTRDHILESAALVFRQKGYHGASMADIADAVQLQKASLYHHFASKQEILVALLDRALEMVIDRVGAVTRQDLPPEEKLRLATRTYLHTLSEQGDLVFVLLLEYRSLDEDLYQHHIPNRDKFEQLWRDLLREGVQAGVFACENIPLAARGLLGTINWTITWYRPGGSLTIEQIADQFASLYLRGLMR